MKIRAPNKFIAFLNPAYAANIAIAHGTTAKKDASKKIVGL